MIQLSDHARWRMKQRNITDDDVARVLCNPRIIVNRRATYYVERKRYQPVTLVVCGDVCTTIYRATVDWLRK